MNSTARRQPREHHYVFAHHVVRQVCAEDPMRFFAIVASAEREQFFDWLWETTARHVGKPIADLDPADLGVTTGRVKDCPAVVLQMPAPEAAAEAHLVGILLVGLTNAANDPSGVGFRYFTLEHGINLDGALRTVLCEWTEQAHRNFGDGPPATVEAFVDALEGVI